MPDMEGGIDHGPQTDPSVRFRFRNPFASGRDPLATQPAAATPTVAIGRAQMRHTSLANMERWNGRSHWRAHV